MDRQLSSVNVAETTLAKRHALAMPSVAESPLRIQTKMEPRWEADGVFLGMPDLSDEVIVGTPRGSRDDTIIQTNDG